MSGSLNVKNSNEGAVFEISLPKPKGSENERA
jgi:hypothetical protein